MMKMTDATERLKSEISRLIPLRNALKSATSFSEKLQLLKSFENTPKDIAGNPYLEELIHSRAPEDQYLLFSLGAIGQLRTVFMDYSGSKEAGEDVQKLLDSLAALEVFYSDLGGIIGYHSTVLQLIVEDLDRSSRALHVGASDGQLFEPEGFDIRVEPQLSVNGQVRSGIENLATICEIYPIGGAGERLNLADEVTGESLPVAELQFCGRTLLEGLLRDLQGREYLYYKLFGVQIVTPVAAMTSMEKHNTIRIHELCEKHRWFGRGRENFKFFAQPLVPMLTVEGNWGVKAPLQLIMRPGGHGVIWKCAADAGVFDWLEGRGYQGAIVRQINNPMAGVDNGLLILGGIGSQKGRGFGFASCPRLIGASEGMNVLKEVRGEDGHYSYCITNIEYTEFEQLGVVDMPKVEGGKYSLYPSNTNILFADIQSVKQAIDVCPIPGLLVNMKSLINCYEGGGKTVERVACRLESTMQNIADVIQNTYQHPLPKGVREGLKTFITFNDRIKTISAIKQSIERRPDGRETPESCYSDMMENYLDLLKNHCGILVENLDGSAVPLHALFHPSLGPLYDVTAQKIRGGRIASGSEWVMEIAEANIEGLDLDGSLIIEATALMGYDDENGKTVYDSRRAGKCTLIDVGVKNKGLHCSTLSEAWRRTGTRAESLTIRCHGNGEFYANGVVFTGDHHYEVPDGERWVATMRDGRIEITAKPIKSATWQWAYAFDKDSRVILSIHLY